MDNHSFVLKHSIKLARLSFTAVLAGYMRLLDNVRLIESDVLASPTASTFERLMTKLASYEHSNSWNKL